VCGQGDGRHTEGSHRQGRASALSRRSMQLSPAAAMRHQRFALHGSSAATFGELIGRGAEADPETAWDGALVTLAALTETVGTAKVEAAMIECAHLAYARLFHQRERPT
jgi:hypothetical protein